MIKNRSKLLGFLLIVGSILATGCITKPENRSSTIASEQRLTPSIESESSKGSYKGVSLSPMSFQADDLTGFFEMAKQAGEIVTWVGDWSELNKAEGNAPAFTAELATVYGYIPLIEAQFFSQVSGALLRPNDETTRQAYRDSAVDFAQEYKPNYLGLGVEVNVLYEKSPGDFDEFVRFFDEVYDAVKSASPNTKVFTVFQLERMKGLKGGLFGGVNDPNDTQWQLLERFPKADLVAFTTYPSLIYKTPAEIPADYYTEIKSHTEKTIAFTEIGWHTDDSLPGWEGSQAEQAEFVRIFFDQVKGLNPEIIIWSFLYDQDVQVPFDSMGLRYRSDGSPKLAWDEWVKAQIR